jgi:hypothetical protein
VPTPGPAVTTPAVSIPGVVEQPAIRLPAAPAPAAPAPSVQAPAGQPTIAPLGPSVEPAPPAGATRDVPAAETAGRLMRIVPRVDDHST